MPKLDDSDIDMEVLEALMCYPSRETSIDEYLLDMVNLINSHDRAGKGMHDPDWLEVVGNPTIPHVQSLRQPPAAVALPVSKEKLIGLTTKNASKRYLQKLQKERERNHEVLTECVDNLPIVIRQMAYPENPPNKTPFRCGLGNVHSAEKKFRVGKLKDDYWQENSEQWVKEETEKEKEKEKENSPRITRKNRTFENHQNGGHDYHHDKEDSNGEFVHHAGFVGVQNQTSALKYRFGKKKGTNLMSESVDSGLSRNTFRPKGFGALYDEMEFERRYKKVFDLNKHIHFVHSNFVSGQRISKRAKLPPIGHNPSVFSDPAEGGDIFAIMSVQKYNYPEEVDTSRSYLPSSSNHRTKPDGPAKRHKTKRPLEIPKEVDVPIGFVPGTVTKTGQSPFDGLKSTPVSVAPSSEFYEKPRDFNSVILETPEEFSQTDRSITSVSNRSKPASEENKAKPGKAKVAKKQNHETLTETKSDDEGEPFNISVHVELKPKGSLLSMEEEEQCTKRKLRDSKHESAKKDKNGNYSNSSSGRDSSQMDAYRSARSECEHDMFRDRIVYPTPISTCDTETRDSSDLESPGHVIRPKQLTITTNQYGVTSQKVKYPDRFVLDDSIAESCRSGSRHSGGSASPSRHLTHLSSASKTHNNTKIGSKHMTS